jgi:hypothetical protein
MKLCVENDNHRFPAWHCGAGNDGISLRCLQGCYDGAVNHHIVMDDVWVGEDAGAVVGEGVAGTCSSHLSLPCCTLHNHLDLAPVSTCLEVVGGKLN